ncbi:hypothetical protein BXZ70DRAFT_910703 [Cristinia sonorae]|uniref:Uncharacterized protein n=1 Tax=Cristinia sonorae TaxID=1940300 RepID=A0A8K0UH52_9AGAR|nr:hypothetical protein BXZ70DRAFT_910703 [Cristinia sonorae]
MFKQEKRTKVSFDSGWEDANTVRLQDNERPLPFHSTSPSTHIRWQSSRGKSGSHQGQSDLSLHSSAYHAVPALLDYTSSKVYISLDQSPPFARMRRYWSAEDFWRPDKRNFEERRNNLLNNTQWTEPYKSGKFGINDHLSYISSKIAGEEKLLWLNDHIIIGSARESPDWVLLVVQIPLEIVVRFTTRKATTTAIFPVYLVKFVCIAEECAPPGATPKAKQPPCLADVMDPQDGNCGAFSFGNMSLLARYKTCPFILILARQHYPVQYYQRYSWDRPSDGPRFRYPPPMWINHHLQAWKDASIGLKTFRLGIFSYLGQLRTRVDPSCMSCRAKNRCFHTPKRSWPLAIDARHKATLHLPAHQLRLLWPVALILVPDLPRSTVSRWIITERLEPDLDHSEAENTSSSLQGAALTVPRTIRPSHATPSLAVGATQVARLSPGSSTDPNRSAPYQDDTSAVLVLGISIYPKVLVEFLKKIRFALGQTRTRSYTEHSPACSAPSQSVPACAYTWLLTGLPTLQYRKHTNGIRTLFAFKKAQTSGSRVQELFTNKQDSVRK